MRKWFRYIKKKILNVTIFIKDFLWIVKNFIESFFPVIIFFLMGLMMLVASFSLLVPWFQLFVQENNIIKYNIFKGAEIWIDFYDDNIEDKNLGKSVRSEWRQIKNDLVVASLQHLNEKDDKEKIANTVASSIWIWTRFVFSPITWILRYYCPSPITYETPVAYHSREASRVFINWIWEVLDFVAIVYIWHWFDRKSWDWITNFSKFQVWMGIFYVVMVIIFIKLILKFLNSLISVVDWFVRFIRSLIRKIPWKKFKGFF